MLNRAIITDTLIEIELPGGTRGLQGIQGIQGEKGSNFNPMIEDVETLDPSEDATASVRTDGDNILFSFGIPQGIPGYGTKLSDFENDVGFVTPDTTDLENYIVKDSTYTQTEVNNLLSTKANSSDVTTALATKVNTSDIVDNLNSTDSTKVLSAKQGKILNEGKVQVFDTVASMKAAGLKNGMAAQTLGYYAVNDGGGATYKIYDDNSVDDGGTVHELTNGLKAKLVDDPSNVAFWGIKTDDNTFDNSIPINKAIIYNKGGEVYIPSGTYYINSPIKTYFSKTNFTNITMKTDTKLVANDTMNYILDIGGLSETYSYEVGNKKNITGGILESNNNVTIAVINIYKYVKDLELSNIQAYYENCDGIICGDSAERTSQDLYIHHCILNHKNEINTNNGILIHSNDNSFLHCRVYFNNKAININGGGTFFEDIHTLSNDLQNDNVGFYVQRGTSFFNNCYCDSEDTCFKIYNSDTSIYPNLFINNFEYYSYRTNQLTFVDMTHNIGKLKMNNIYIFLKENANKHKGIVCSYDNILRVMTNYSLTCDGLHIENDEYMRNGDILKGLISNTKGKTLFKPSSNNMTQNTWYLLGYYPSNTNVWTNFEITISNRTTKIPLSLRCVSSGEIRQDIGTGTLITDDTATYQLGAKFENSGYDSSNDYPVVGLYIRETSTHGRIINDYKMLSNYVPAISLPKNIFSRELPTSTETMDKIYNLDCPNKTLSVAT